MTDTSDTTDDSASRNRGIERLLSLSGVAGPVGAWLWADQGELAVAAVLLVAGLGLLVARAQLDGLVDVRASLGSVWECGRTVALVALVALSVVGMQLAPVVLLDADHDGIAVASPADAEEQDLTEYDKYDLNGQISSVSGSTVDFTGVKSGDDFHLNDYKTTAVDGDAEIHFTYELSSYSGAPVFFAGFTGSSLDNRRAGNRSGVALGDAGGSNAIAADANGQRDIAYNSVSTGTQYFVSVYHFAGNTTTRVDVYSDADRTNKLGSGSVPHPEDTYNYTNAMLSDGGSASGSLSGTISNFSVVGQKADVGTSIETSAVEQDFENQPADSGVAEDWIDVSPDGSAGTFEVTTSQAYSGSQAYYLENTDSQKTKSQYNLSEPTTNDVRAVLRPDGRIEFSSQDTDGTEWLDIETDRNDGTLLANGGSTTLDTDTQLNEWIEIRVYNIDFAAETYDISWESPSTFGTAEDVAFDSSVSGDSYDQIQLEAAATSGDAGYYDDIKIAAESEPVSGTVTDSSGDPITDATVEAVNTSTGSVADSTTTDSSGNYELSLLTGEYDIVVSNTISVYSNSTKTVTVPEGGKTVDFTLTSNTVVDSPSPSPETTVSSGPVDLSVRVNSTNPSVSSIDVEFYEVTNDSVDPENDTQIGSTTVAPDERAGVTWDPAGGTYEWYVVATADDGGTTVGGPYALAVGEAVVLEDSEQPTDGAIVDPSANVTLAVDVQTQDNATVSFYEFQTGNPANDQLIGFENVTNGTTTTSTVWNSTVRSSSDEWYVVLEDDTGVRDTAGAFSFGPGGQVVARDAKTGAVIDDRTVRFETTYPGGSETFDRSSGKLDLSDSNAAAGDSIRIKVKTQDYYSRVVEVPDKQTDTDLYLERGANWSYSPSNDDPEDTASVENDSSRFISRFTLRDETGRYPPRNTTLTVRADVDDDGRSELVHRSSFGSANRVDVPVKEGRRYQLRVANTEGDSRGLGGWTATEPDTTTLTISRVTQEIELDQGYGVDAVVENGTLNIYYQDYETSAETLNLEIREYPDGPYLENRTLSDVENATVTIALNESMAKKVWQIDYEGTRIGVEAANISGQVTTSATGRVPLLVGSDVLIAGALIILAIVGALFTGPLSAIGSVGMVGVAGVLYFIGWLPINAAALWVATIIAVGSVLRSGGGRLG